VAAAVGSAVGLRPGQREALLRWREALRAGSRSELVVVPVGYGKTVIGVGSAEVAAETIGADTCLYLTPTGVLRKQVYDGAGKALRLAGSTRAVRKAYANNAAPARVLTSGANLVVATYQQVIAAPHHYTRFCRERRVHLVCDEAHHLGERGRWADVIGSLGAVSTLLLSATPVRLDRAPIAGARYLPAGDREYEIDPLVHVSMRQAWREGGILKHLSMQMKDYAVQLRDSDGNLTEFTASQMAELPDFDQRVVRQQLRWNEDYVQPLVREFALTLQSKLALAPGQHQGLVFAATTEHANHLLRVFERWHPELRCVVVHSGAISDAENERRLRHFHARKYDVLIQVKKASEGFDAPTVSVLLKLDAVFSREPVIQQLGRGLRYNHALGPEQNLLNVFIGRDPRLAGIIEHLEREAAIPTVRRQGEAEGPDAAADLSDDEDLFADDAAAEDEARGPEIVDVVEAGDAYLDHTGQYVEGQQLTMFGVAPPAPLPLPGRERAPVLAEAGPAVVDLAAELRDAVEYCKLWTNRAARRRREKFGATENHHAALNFAYARETGMRGALATPEQYRAKGDWMRRQFLAMG
jgi:superfamily II DNA or RNA helicase